MITGPTQNYADPDVVPRRARPALAFAVRTAIAGGPLALALVVGAVAALLLPPARVGLPVWLWLLGVVATTSAMLYACSRALRRLAPLSALLRLSLVLPDDVPHRFALARRRWSPSALQKTQDREVEGIDGVDTDDEQPSQRLLALVATLAAHDVKTRAHAERVQAYAALIGREMGLPADDVDRLSWAALLHDVGKIHVAPEIINKASRPSEAEWAQLQTHPHHGGQLVQPLRDWLGDWLDGVEQHHERFDGKGYPHHLAGQDISLAARIISVADTYDVITSARAYKKPMTAEQARAEITRCAGAQFDPEVVRALLSVGVAKLRRIAGPATLLAALPVIIAAPAQAASSVGVAAQAVGGHAAAAVLAASVGVAGGVTAADVMAAPPGAAMLVVQDTSATDAEGGSSERRVDDSGDRPRAGDVAPSKPGPGEPAAMAPAQSTPSAAEPADPSAGDLSTAAPSQPASLSPFGSASVGSSDNGPRVPQPSATTAAGATAKAAVPTPTRDTDPRTSGTKAGSADEEAKRAAKEAQQAAERAAKEQVDRAQAADKAAKQAADATKAAQDAADKAARQAAKDAADAAKAAQEAAEKTADKAAKKAAETAGKLTTGLTSGSSGSPSASSGAPSPSSTPTATASSGSSGGVGLIDGLLRRGR